MQSSPSVLRWRWVTFVYVRMVVHVRLCLLSPLSSASLPHKAVTQDQLKTVVYVRVLCWPAVKPGPLQVLWRSVFKKSRLAQAWMGSQRSVSTCEGLDRYPCECPCSHCFLCSSSSSSPSPPSTHSDEHCAVFRGDL